MLVYCQLFFKQKIMRRCLLAAIAFFVVFSGFAQITENFGDGDYTANPAWTPGNPADWVVNATNELQSNNTTANSSYSIATSSNLAMATEWLVKLKLNFNTSSTNYTDIFLIASAADVLAATTTGYFVRLGGTTDEISLYRKDNGSITRIIDGADGPLNTSNNNLMIRVVRDGAGQFSLQRDLAATGSTWFLEGTATDITYTNSLFFALAIRQSTASFFQKHFFSSIIVRPFVPDTTPPTLLSVTGLSTTQADVLFSESVNLTTAQQIANYSVSNGIGNPISAVRDATNAALVHLVFANTFPNGSVLTLTANNILDDVGNAGNNLSGTFFYYTPQRYDVVISEIMADPTPVVALPANEWLELKNTSGFPINLGGWRIGDNGGLSAALPGFLLQPDSQVIICATSAAPAMALWGTTLAVGSFPSLDNNGELLWVQTATGQIMHSVQYHISWYKNELKQDGGWSLEMKDASNACTGQPNWAASESATGGTPGKKNSIAGANSDSDAPGLLKSYLLDSLTLVLVFTETVDSMLAANPTAYNVSDGIGNPVAVRVVAPLYQQAILTLANGLQRQKIYTVQAANIKDCAGNSIGTKNNIRTGLHQIADSMDVVINEILFNPPSNGSDYVELYNRSNKIINLAQLYLANRSTNGTISNITLCSSEPQLLFPNEFVLLSENINWVRLNFVPQQPEALLAMPTMPSYNDDEGNVIVLNFQGRITDEVAYDKDWHFKLISNDEGVALERIDYNAASQNADNWHSAASAVNYGTPTYKNSQFRRNDGVQGEVKTLPEIISPNNDGVDDFATITYQFPEPGYVANITVFDAAGRIVKLLQRNALCGTTGSFRWDGLGDKNQQLPTGIYIVLAEVFNLQGKRKQFKQTVVVARRS
jgi:hypothetical protein